LAYVFIGSLLLTEIVPIHLDTTLKIVGVAFIAQ